jgi:hypothetical protein
MENKMNEQKKVIDISKLPIEEFATVEFLDGIGSDDISSLSFDGVPILVLEDGEVFACQKRLHQLNELFYHIGSLYYLVTGFRDRDNSPEKAKVIFDQIREGISDVKNGLVDEEDTYRSINDYYNRNY